MVKSLLLEKQGKAEALGFSQERLEKIPRFFDNYIKEKKLAGFMAMVARKDGIAHLSCRGTLGFDKKTPLKTDSIFRIYSMTKPITAIALMMLFEEGRISLDDPVAKYIPSFADFQVWQSGAGSSMKTVPLNRPMTIWHLLTHTAGFTYEFMREHPVENLYHEAKMRSLHADNIDLAGWISRLSTIPLLFQSGTAWNYSVAMEVCGYIIEVVSGDSLDVFLKKRIFKPLGMKDTGFGVREKDLHRLPVNYYRSPNGKDIIVADRPEKTIFHHGRKFFSGGGGLVSTMEDYYRFCRMLLGKGSVDGKRIVGRKTLSLMTQNHLPNNVTLSEYAKSSFGETGFAGVGFGLGFAVVVDPVTGGSMLSKGSYYWGGLASTFFWVDPVEEITAVFMTQLMPSSSYPLRGQLDQLVNAALL